MLKDTTLHSLKMLLPRGQVFTNRASLIAYEADGGVDKGLPDGVVFPASVEELAQVARWASEHQVPLVARGAGTGLSGGAVADRGGIIVEFSRMNRILDIDERGRSAVVEPGMINLRLDERVKPLGLYFPPDPASQRASTIGGNVAENSGGPHCFKYGVTTNYVTGLEAVLASGEHIRVGGAALDYPEYDLCGLITGSEGMLAMITQISLRLQRNPPGVKTMLVIFDTVEQAGNAVSSIIAAGLIPATMEMMDRHITAIIEPFARAGLPLDAGAILIIEIDGYPQSLDEQIEEIVDITQRFGGRDLRISTNEEERAKIWLARKSAGGAIARLTPSYMTVDITVPRSKLAEILADVDEIVARYQLRAGHLLHAGDGNLHPMLLIPDPEDQAFMRRIHEAGREMVECSVSKGGSLTGEHGVGIEKRDFMNIMHRPEELLAMWDVKMAFDPDNILNPGKVFPRPRAGEDGPYAGYCTAFVREREGVRKEIGATFVPSSAEEAAEGLVALGQQGRKAIIARTNRGNRHPGVTRIDTSALSGIVHYAPHDLYITVGAGTPLAEVQTFLAREHKQLGIVSPWEDATVGGLIASNCNAPLRMRYGAIRDLVLSTTVALPDGRIIRTGRPIVKNVAGYDLTKAFVGSYGSLGLITDVTLKLNAPPRVQQVLLLPVENVQQGVAWAQHLLPLALVASALVLYKNDGAVAELASPYILSYTVEGLPGDVEAEVAQVRQLLRDLQAPEPLQLQQPAVSGTATWVRLLRRAAEDQQIITRTGLPSREIASYLQQNSITLEEGNFLADFANGQLYATRNIDESVSGWLHTLRTSALALGGYTLVMQVAEEWRERIDVWGYRPQGLTVMKALKRRWDPQHILLSDLFIW